MENLPFDLPHTIYINNLRNMKGLGGLDNIYYVALIKKVLWDQEVYHVFEGMDDDSKHTIIVKGFVVAKQQFSKTNLKAMKVAIEQNLKEAPQVDFDAINKRKQKRLAKAITDEDRGLNSFGIAKKIQKIMNEK